MDFYGFSSEVQQANAMQGSADLANAAYNAYNMSAENEWRNKMIAKAQKPIDAANKTLDTDTKREAREGGEQGGGTLAGAYGVYSVGTEIGNTLSNQGKAIRIAEAQMKIAQKSGDVAEIGKAAKMLSTAKTGKMAEYAKAAAELATSKLGGKNADAALELANKIRQGSTFNVAAQQLAGTRAGRQASDIITQQAERINQEREAPEEEDDVLSTGGDDFMDEVAARGEQEGGEGIADVGSNFAANGGELGGEVGDRLAQAAASVISKGSAATTSAVNSATTAVDSVEAPVADTAEQVAGAATDAAPAAVKSVEDLGGFSRTPATIENYNPQDLDTDDFLLGGADDAAFTGNLGERFTNTLSTLGNTGSRAGGGFLSRFSRQIDLGSDTSDIPVGAVMEEGGSVAQRINGFNQLDEANKAAASVARRVGAPFQPPNLEPEPEGPPELDDPQPAEQPPARPEDFYESEEEVGAEGDEGLQTERVITTQPPASSQRVNEQPEDEEEGGQGEATETVKGAEGASPEAVAAGTAEHEAEVAQHGFDSRALDAGAEALDAAASAGGIGTKAAAVVGKTALSGIKTAGRAMKVAAPVVNALFLGDQTYNEISSISKGHGLSGDGWQGKTGGVLQEVGDLAATAAPVLAAFGPLGDVAALGVEVGGGLLSLGGDLLGDWGTYEKEKQQRAKDQAAKAAAVKAQKAYNTSYNRAVETAAAAGNVNLSGQGTIAQSSQSAVRAY